MTASAPAQAATVNKLLQDAPLDKVLLSLCKAVAAAQRELDQSAVEFLKEYSKEEHSLKIPGQGEKRTSLLALGFTPSFLHIQEATITAKVTFTCTEETEFSVGAKVGVEYKIFSASVSANYTNKYSFKGEGSSEIKTKIVSCPMPAELASRLRGEPPKKP